MPEFYFVMIVLFAIASCFVIFPIMLNRSTVDHDRSVINVGLFKQRLNELEAEKANQVIEEDEFQRLKVELERRLLDETAAGSPNPAPRQVNQIAMRVRLAIFAVVPVVAYLVYQQVGAKADWEIVDTLKQVRFHAAAGQDTKADIQQLLRQLNLRLEQQPANPEYLMTVASVQMETENYPAAAEAYQRLVALYPSDPRLLGSYAQALYLSADRTLTTQVKAVADKALSIDPKQSGILGMLGMASFETQDYRSAILYWTKLAALLEPNSDNQQMISKGIEQAKTLLLASGGVSADELNKMTSGSEQSEQKTAAVTVRVSIDSSLTPDPDAAVFVFARAVVGPPMPLAVALLRVSDLPATVQLDDSMAMAPSLKLSSFDKVNIVARVSKEGTAIRGSGDIEGKFGPLEVIANKDLVSIVIETIVP